MLYAELDHTIDVSVNKKLMQNGLNKAGNKDSKVIILKNALRGFEIGVNPNPLNKWGLHSGYTKANNQTVDKWILDRLF